MSSEKIQDEEATLAEEERRSPLVFHHLNEVTEPIDPRIRPSDLPSSEVLDESYREQLNDYLHHREHHAQLRPSSSGSDIEKEKDKLGLPVLTDSEPIYVSSHVMILRDYQSQLTRRPS